jgi:HEAT repeat protein
VSVTAQSGERAALAKLLGVLPPSVERRQQLLALLDDNAANVREAAAIALAHAADPHAVLTLVQRLAEPPTVHESNVLLALGGGLAAHARGRQLDTTLQDAVFKQLSGPRLESPDASIAAATLSALRSLADPRAPQHIAQLLRTGSMTRRAAALLALGDYDVIDIRRLLRFVLQTERPELALNAALALAEIGTEHDAEALLRAAERHSWPLPPAAAYALARIAKRGVVKKHTLANVLCRLGRQSNPHVRANAAAGLAALAAPACDSTLTPEAWLDPALPSVVRVAAVRWLQARPELDETSGRTQRLLAECAHDPEASVAQACRTGIPQPIAGGRLWVRTYASDGFSVQRTRLVALRRPDASVFVGPSDANGEVILPLDDGDPSDVLLEDPADVPQAGPRIPGP